MRRAAIIPLTAALLAAVFCFLRLGATPFDDPGEGMHAEIARELLHSGDPLRLTFNGVVYVDKPPLLYWLEAGAFTLFGASEGTARAVSAAAAVAAVAATAWLGVKLLGPVGGCLAGAALLTSALFFAYARYVRPDALFVAVLAWGFALTLIGIADGRRWLVGWGLVAFGIAGLAKDPLGALAPPIVVLAALALRGQARPLSRWLPWPSIAACVVLGVGWWIFSEASTAGTLWYTVVDNKILNVLGARVLPDEDVPLSAAEFVTVAVLGALPWSLGAVVTIIRLARARAWLERAETLWIALSLWTLGILAITVVSRFRLPHYGLPVYPALALLAARAWLGSDTRWLAGTHAGLLAVLSVGGAALARSDGRSFMTTVIGATDVATRKARIAGEADPFPGWETLQPLVAHASLVFGVAALVLIIGLALRARLRTSALAPSVVALAMLAVMPDVATALGAMSTYRSTRAVATVVTLRLGSGDVLAHEGPIEQSGALEWYSGRRPIIVDGRRSVLAFGATRRESAAVFWTEADLERAWRQQRVWIVTARSPAHSVATRLPGARLVGTFGARWLYGPPEPR